MEGDTHRLTGLYRATLWNHRACQLQIGLALILLLLLPGCISFKAYPGPERQPDEIAIIECNYWQSFWFFGHISLHFTAVQGNNMDLQPWTKIYMEPGPHSVSFTYTLSSMGYTFNSYYGRLTFTALKGHLYKLDAEREDGELWAWIIDQASGEIVAGERPP